MDNTLLIIWLVIAVIAITAYFVSNANTDPEEEEEQEKYPAVIIVFDEAEACPSVMGLAGQRLLSTEAPLLPLIDCTSRECTCTYRHYIDRRGGSRRFNEKSVVKRLHKGIEMRVRQRGRRAEDLMEDTFKQTQDPVYETHTDTYYDYIDRTGLFKAMAAKEAEDSTRDSSDQDPSDQTPSDQDPYNQAPSDQAPSDQASVATFTPATSNQRLAPASSDQKKSGQSRS
jgi:hypothetical protein